MIRQIILSILVGIATWAVVYLLGVIVGNVSASIGAVLVYLSPIFGIVAGVWYFFTNRL